ncbi:mercuric reductase [Anabaena cylindrica FACHB-243]|uniref:Dihydrolipoyl dehydrogenase n=1 Tax=Anabaena cylindrica (strain ATCC 27899 / PCC 7122) TaxID=272123 RepID=K9ZQ19_ANACC|nr:MULTISPECIES: mercuric reductase [Anabaena]AFZ60647.1 Dihydrolipoyl dehydrogenase [Anabaena cylindrica PCC 7122]MBD2417066.1 mercuric reductase [Anabaena cylindrica FACHB-243]MBY5284560.1 mercuric reductase [Anabaena sp. CCAP 1446/1C]MBY5307576.1 mercuric reductase [Anabaena sp. CCAP 1446/1C]MCM2407165.1 mercuric reductase [Anabaena sp. CCAP 1446/1C]
MSITEFERVTVLPMDEYNQKLVANVHPGNWVNPQPVDCYDLVVIGAGTAGLVVAAGAAGLDLGLKVALIEKNLMGGDCLNVGCIPSKCLIRSSRVVGEIWKAKDLGINISQHIEVDFSTVMARLRRIRAGISHHDSATRFQNLGVDVFLGNGKFASKNTVEVGGKILKFKKAVIATGARAVKPAIIGIEEAGYLTNETVFSLIQKPNKLAVIGGGPIGCELAQTFQRLGCEVTLFHNGSHILNKEDKEAAEILQKVLIAEGIRLVLNSKLEEVVTVTEGKRLYFSAHGHRDSVTVNEILVGAGRAPNVEGLNLETVGVEYDKTLGVKVNDYLQTTNPKIYAAGDICMNWKFTHAADAAARIVIKNTLFSPFGWGRSQLSSLVMPWVTYTDPEIAHVGMYADEAEKLGIEITTIKIPFSSVDRAIADSEESGFLKIHHRKGSDEIIGATIVANHAGEMISEITTAIVNKIGLSKLSSVIHPYPTQAEAIKKAADAYRRTLLTPRTKKILEYLTKLS